MKKFKNKKTGIILIPKSQWVEKQLEASNEYIVIDSNCSNVSTKTKAIKDYTCKELIAYLTNLGIECNDKMKKADLLALVPNKDEE